MPSRYVLLRGAGPVCLVDHTGPARSVLVISTGTPSTVCATGIWRGGFATQVNVRHLDGVAVEEVLASLVSLAAPPEEREQEQGAGGLVLVEDAIARAPPDRDSRFAWKRRGPVGRTSRPTFQVKPPSWAPAR